MNLKYLLAFCLVITQSFVFAAQKPQHQEKQNAQAQAERFDIIICGGTPAGIMTAIAAARMGKTSLILERSAHIGGLPANGLGATDIATRGATGGLFLEFVNNIKDYYVEKYGADSKQAEDCSDGYRFEPSVAEKVFLEMIKAHPEIKVLYQRQLDAQPENVSVTGHRIQSIRVWNRDTEKPEMYEGDFFIDATYEGDLIAAAGAPYIMGREGIEDFDEPYAGRVYKYWNGPAGPASTFLGDNAVQAYNYRLCLTKDKENMVSIPKPEDYDRKEYVSLIEDVLTGRHGGFNYTKLAEAQQEENRQRVQQGKPPIVPGMPEGINRLVTTGTLPNGKFDGNNQHLALISTDLPEENWPWPTSGWDWRDQFAERLKSYTLGLLWFAQHDPELPTWFREECLQWGLAKDEYVDNDHFPRQVYVREGRRLKGNYLFKAEDALPVFAGSRPPVHQSSITASHYAIDSHAVRKREAGKVHLEGFLSYKTQPYTVPYEVMVTDKVQNLLAPVPVSATHLGFSTLRMEPCWMALGQAAGVAASIALGKEVAADEVPVNELQAELLDQKAVLMYFEDVQPTHPQYKALQWLALQGLVPAWEAQLEEPVTEKEKSKIADFFGMDASSAPKINKRGVFYQWVYDQQLSEK